MTFSMTNYKGIFIASALVASIILFSFLDDSSNRVPINNKGICLFDYTDFENPHHLKVLTEYYDISISEFGPLANVVIDLDDNNYDYIPTSAYKLDEVGVYYNDGEKISHQKLVEILSVLIHPEKFNCDDGKGMITKYL